ncbi:MAG: hypothetical protein AB7P35_17830 [Hyphomonadaceae bacterium]
MIDITAMIFALAAGAAGALAYGYRGQREQEREQVTYLRKRLERFEPQPEPSAPQRSTAVTTVHGGRP